MRRWALSFFQYPCLLGLVQWVKMCGSQDLALISTPTFFSTATRGPLCWRLWDGTAGEEVYPSWQEEMGHLGA